MPRPASTGRPTSPIRISKRTYRSSRRRQTRGEITGGDTLGQDLWAGAKRGPGAARRSSLLAQVLEGKVKIVAG